MNQVKVPNQEIFTLIKEHILNNQDAVLRVQGTSMYPFFKHQKTLVTLSKATTLKKRDIILFEFNGSYKLHRIIKVQTNQIIAQGDYTYQKEYLLEDDVIAKVINYRTNDKTHNVHTASHLIYLCLWRLIKPLIIFMRRLYAKLKRRTITCYKKSS